MGGIGFRSALPRHSTRSSIRQQREVVALALLVACVYCVLSAASAAETDPLLKGLKKSGMVELSDSTAAAPAPAAKISKVPATGCAVGHEWMAFDSAFAARGGARRSGHACVQCKLDTFDHDR